MSLCNTHCRTMSTGLSQRPESWFSESACLALASLLRGDGLGLVHTGQEEVAVARSRRHLRRQPLLPHRLLVGWRCST